jgi:hypothetical protein
MTFSTFESAWDRGEIRDAHDHRTETDFIEWEALEQEKEHWLHEMKRIIESFDSGDKDV